jgi:hypothetical protein
MQTKAQTEQKLLIHETPALQPAFNSYAKQQVPVLINVQCHASQELQTVRLSPSIAPAHAAAASTHYFALQHRAATAG